MTDEDLLRRFAALKGAAAEAGPSRLNGWAQNAARKAKEDDKALEEIADGRPVDPASAWGSIRGDQDEEEEEERVLRGRLGGLRGNGQGWMGANELDDDDEDVEAFIASLSPKPPEHAGTDGLRRDRSTKAFDSDLQNEAETILRATRHLVDTPTEHEIPSGSPHGADQAIEDEETEEDILEKAIAEVRLEEDSPVESGSPDLRTQHRTGEGEDALFPSIPAHQPLAALDTNESEPDLELDKRIALLLGLSGPSSIPSIGSLPSAPQSAPKARSAGQGYNLPGWNDGRDEDLDSWCCICNKDATIRCDGCDGDLYCDECWKDGHGPGGEVGHRARRFTWNRKGRSGTVA